MNRILRRLVPLAILTLLYLPLRAAEQPPPQPGGGEELPAAEDTTEKPAEPPAPPRRSRNAGRDEEDRLSLDNNLSFPVDI